MEKDHEKLSKNNSDRNYFSVGSEYDFWLNEEDDIYDDYQRELEKARTDLPS